MATSPIVTTPCWSDPAAVPGSPADIDLCGVRPWQNCVRSACKKVGLTLGVVVNQVHAKDGATCWGGDGECRTQAAPKVGIWRRDAHAGAKGVLQGAQSTACVYR